MAQYCDQFRFNDAENDSFQFWNGLRGPEGPQGPEGPPGQGLVIKGVVATVADLPTPALQGDVYLVGASEPYEGYLWTNGAWVDIGELAIGPEGPQGPAGTITVGTVSGLPAGSTPTVTNTGTAEAAVLNFGIPAGADGAPGQDGQDGAPGPGVASGGTTGQMLTKKSNTDYDTEWTNQPTIPSAYTSTPEMDGTASAGSSSAWSRGDHVHPHDSLIVRKNHLDNGYFVGGGSQQGYGYFPINQRGQTIYNTNWSYAIDRWIFRGTRTVTLTANGVNVGTGTGGETFAMVQTLPGGGRFLQGKTITFSVLFSSDSTIDGNLQISQSDLPSTVGTSIGVKSINTAGLHSITATIPDTLSNTYLNVQFNTATDNVTFTILAAKVEIGDTQTLAHQSNGTWVLNEIPDFAEELAKCEAYLLKVQSDGTYKIITIGFAVDSTRFRGYFATPVTMRVLPSMTISGTLEITPAEDLNAPITVTGGFVHASTAAGLVLNLSVASGLVAGKSYFLRTTTSNADYLLFSAEP